MMLRDVLAGTSSAIMYWLVICAGIMGEMIWEQRLRIWHWRYTSRRERADLSLNTAMFLFLVAAVSNRARLILTFVNDDHVLYPETTTLIQLQVPVSFCACLLFMWWGLYEIAGDRNRFWWLTHVAIGLFLAVVMAVTSMAVNF